jgi:hypothetical protein
MYSDAKDHIVSFGVKNLATLTIEGIHNFIVSIVIPRLARVWKCLRQQVIERLLLRLLQYYTKKKHTIRINY